MKRRARFLWICGVLALGLSGCKHQDSDTTVTSPHSSKSSTSHPGWVETTCAGVSISLPSELSVIDLSGKDVDTIKGEVNRLFSGAPDVMKAAEAAMSNGHLKFMAMDASAGPGAFRNNVNLVELPVPAGITLDTLIAANKAQLEKMAVPGKMKTLNDTFHAGKAGEFQSELDMHNGQVVASDCFILIHGNNQIVLTFTSSIPDEKKWIDLAKQAMESVRFP